MEKYKENFPEHEEYRILYSFYLKLRVAVLPRHPPEIYASTERTKQHSGYSVEWWIMFPLLLWSIFIIGHANLNGLYYLLTFFSTTLWCYESSPHCRCWSSGRPTTMATPILSVCSINQHTLSDVSSRNRLVPQTRQAARWLTAVVHSVTHRMPLVGHAATAAGVYCGSVMLVNIISKQHSIIFIDWSGAVYQSMLTKLIGWRWYFFRLENCKPLHNLLSWTWAKLLRTQPTRAIPISQFVNIDALIIDCSFVRYEIFHTEMLLLNLLCYQATRAYFHGSIISKHNSDYICIKISNKKEIVYFFYFLTSIRLLLRQFLSHST